MIYIWQLGRKLAMRLGMGFLLLNLAGCQIFSGQSTYSVKRVSDGDTLVIVDGGKDTTVRFACVDAAEVPHSQKQSHSRKVLDKNQFNWGLKAQSRVQQLVNQGSSRVILKVTNTDRYGRKIGEVRLPNGTLIQQVLVEEGLALVYRPHLRNCPSASTIEQAEIEAKKNGRGVWSDPKFTPPWEYRRIK